MTDGTASRRLPWTMWRDKVTGQPRIFETVLPNGRKEIIMGWADRGPAGLPWYTDLTLGAGGYFETPEAAMDAIDRKYGLVEPDPSADQLQAARSFIAMACALGIVTAPTADRLMVGSPREIVANARDVLIQSGASAMEYRISSASGSTASNVDLARKAVRLMDERKSAVEALLSGWDYPAAQIAAFRRIAGSRAEIEALLDNLTLIDSPPADPAPPPSLPAPEVDTGDSE